MEQQRLMQQRSMLWLTANIGSATAVEIDAVSRARVDRHLAAPPHHHHTTTTDATAATTATTTAAAAATTATTTAATKTLRYRCVAWTVY